MLAFRDYRKLENYRYVIVVVSLGLLVLPRVPGSAIRSTAPISAIRVPGLVVFQPTEFAKVGLVVFLASYLRDTRQMLASGRRVSSGSRSRRSSSFGPVLVIWGIAMLILVLLHDIGSSLMFYGGLLAVLYVATNRISFVVIGLIAFGIGAWYLGTHIPHIDDRVTAWLHPFNAAEYNKGDGQLPARQRDLRAGRGRACSARGSGRRC